MGALHDAVEASDIRIMAKLIADGADVDEVPVDGDWPGYSPLSLAARLGHVDAARFLLESGAKDTDNYVSTGACHIEILRLYLERGGEPNLVVDEEGQTLLMQVARGDVSLVKELVLAGADVNVVARNGHSALRNAMDAGNEDVVDFLWARSSREVREGAGYIDDRRHARREEPK